MLHLQAEFSPDIVHVLGGAAQHPDGRRMQPAGGADPGARPLGGQGGGGGAPRPASGCLIWHQPWISLQGA
jgi:hypothetical protein